MFVLCSVKEPSKNHLTWVGVLCGSLGRRVRFRFLHIFYFPVQFSFWQTWVLVRFVFAGFFPISKFPVSVNPCRNSANSALLSPQNSRVSVCLFAAGLCFVDVFSVQNGVETTVVAHETLLKNHKNAWVQLAGHPGAIASSLCCVCVIVYRFIAITDVHWLCFCVLCCSQDTVICTYIKCASVCVCMR